MLAGAAARLARPQLAACVAHWRSEWEAEGKAAAAQARKAERSALADSTCAKLDAHSQPVRVVV